MPHRFVMIKASALFLFGLSFTLYTFLSLFSEPENNKPVAETISVRESNSELQVSVGDKIFVFGKAKGTLDKVKVGMHVLHFTQVADSQGGLNTFSKVSWKKLKDGSIHIQSSYNPWPQSLSWTVFADGKLKLDASAPPIDIVNSRWLGLGFNFPDQALHQLSWQSTGMDSGTWKNLNYVPLSNPEIEVQNRSQGVFQSIRSIRMEFETVILDVNTQTSGVFFGLGQNEISESSIPNLDSDMIFLFNKPIQNNDKIAETPSEGNTSGPSITASPLVLWFHFQ